MSPRLRAFVGAAVASLWAIGTTLGDQSQQPTFVGGTQAVRVDIHATRDGEPVSDLQRGDVQVFEDGTLQAIQTFERITYARPGAAPTVTAGTLTRSRELLADARSRVFVVFLDVRHTSYLSPQVQARFPIFRTLERLMGPDDLVAVMTPDMRAGDISFERGLAGLARLEGTPAYSVINPDPGMQHDDRETLYRACFPPEPDFPISELIARYREKVAFDALDDLVGYLGVMRQEPTHVFAITDGWRVFTENPRLMKLPEGPRLPTPPIGGRGRGDTGVITERGAVNRSEATLRECDADLPTLSSLDHRDRLREIAAHANASNVSLYPISARGLTTTPAGAPPAVRTTFQNTNTLFNDGLLRALAEDTGGSAIVGTNNLGELLEDLMTRTSAFYLASYSSTNGALDGKYRRITVKVNRPGVEVRARHGYVATRPDDRRTLAPDAPAKPDPVAAALGTLDLQIRLAAEKTATAASAAASDVVLYRRGSAPALPFEKTIDPRFRRNERIRVALVKRGTAPPTARLLDRRGGMLTVITQIAERPDATRTWTEVELPLASLTVGDYAIEVTSGDDIRVVAFRIVP